MLTAGLIKLTAVVLNIVDSNISGHKRSALVFFLVPLFCQKLGFGIFCVDNILYLCTAK